MSKIDYRKKCKGGVIMPKCNHCERYFDKPVPYTEPHGEVHEVCPICGSSDFEDEEDEEDEDEEDD